MSRAYHGVLVVNKPQGMTSHDVVLAVRRRCGTRQVGHAGTLDPMARGVLIVLVGDATKHQHALQTHRKIYEAVIQFGLQTDTGDAWGRPLQAAPVPVFDRAQVEAALQACVGRMTQIPPRFSAVKVQGRPLYWWTRRGIPRTAPPRIVEITTLELLAFSGDRCACRIACSSGTYIRTLAESIAQRLGTIGHVCELTRCAVGPWGLAQAVEVPWITAASDHDVQMALRPVGAGLGVSPYAGARGC